MTSATNAAVGSDTVFVVPIGPNCSADFVADTIESIRHFAPMARVILVDDSRRELGLEMSERFELALLEAPARGVFGGLYLNLSEGFREALTHQFKILVRLDTDALVTGSDFEAKAVEKFGLDPTLGSLGSFRVGYDGVGFRSARWAKRRFIAYFSVRALTNPRAANSVLRLLLRARKNGYKLGDSIMGGAAIYRYELIVSLAENHLLGQRELAKTGLQEDYIFGLCIYSTGFHLGEFGNRFDDLPMGVNWRSLPASPRELMERGKSIVHSTKEFERMDEQAIRAEFRAARTSF